MTTKVNGYSTAGDFTRRNMDFYTVRSVLDFTPTGSLSAVSQQRFDFLVETISTRAQPVILGQVFTTIETGPVSGLPVTVSGVSAYTIYNVRFAIEHEGAWENTNVSLAESLDGLHGFVYTFPVSANNVMVKRDEFMNFKP